MSEIASLKIEVVMSAANAEKLLSLVEAASSANRSLQSALENLAGALLDGSLELQSVPAGSRCPLTKGDVVPAGAYENLPVLDAVSGQ